mmetsp:Transcript_9071/g.15586  ORF Transcript_9071/g.15586 Transcript_9071/m.15586 type:complete len:401 (-) Transcript_9071:1484-2686(-)
MKSVLVFSEARLFMCERSSSSCACISVQSLDSSSRVPPISSRCVVSSRMRLSDRSVSRSVSFTDRLSSATAFLSPASVSAGAFFALVTRAFIEIRSRLKIAFSISVMSFSCCRASSVLRSSMRWISFFMASTMSPPMVGSKASCISFSSWILRSQSMICRSDSISSASTCFFSSAQRSIFCSSLTASASRSFSRETMSISSTKLSLASISCSCVFLLMSALMRPRSLCMAFMAMSSSLISLFTCSNCVSRRVRRWRMTVCSDLSRCTVSTMWLFSFTKATSSTWNPTHRRCRSLPSTPLLTISRCRLLMVASSGPVLASSMLAVSFSYCLLYRSTSLVFFSISSLRRRISTSYFSIVLPFSLSSSSSRFMVSLSLVLCACVLRMSTLILASSFCSATLCS